MTDSDFQAFVKRLILGANDVYFRDVVKAMTGYKVIEASDDYGDMIAQIKTLLRSNLKAISKTVEKNYIGRSNEFGNFLESILATQIKNFKRFQTFDISHGVGYPDIMIDANGRHIYIECKTYQDKTLNSSLRSFYFKVSDKNKIKHSCPHILIGFEVESKGGNNSSPFIVNDFKIVDLFNLKVSLKPEFNASNPMIYKGCKIL